MRTGKSLGVHNPLLFLAHERELAEEAWAGDIIGIPNHGTLRHRRRAHRGRDPALHRHPELRPRVPAPRPPRRPDAAPSTSAAPSSNSPKKAAAQVFKPLLGADWIVGVVGALQFDVLADRIRSEYDIPVPLRGTSFEAARWVDSDDPQLIKKFADANQGNIAEDHAGAPVFLARNAWHLETTGEEWPDLKFLKTKEQVQ